MKRILLVFFTLSLFLIFISCDTPLTEYKPKNEDEKQIVDLLQKYTDARNNEDGIGWQATFHDDGKLIVGTGTEHTKDQIAKLAPEMVTTYGKLAITNPNIKINGDKAQVSMNTWLGKAKWEAVYNLVKEDGNWLILEARH